jgi:single-stranded-DNA-specific exonuclease
MAVWQVRQRMAAAGGPYDIHTIYAAIQVLREIGVIAIRDSAAGPAYYFPQLSGKMDLNASMTYAQYHTS